MVLAAGKAVAGEAVDAENLGVQRGENVSYGVGDSVFYAMDVGSAGEEKPNRLSIGRVHDQELRNRLRR